MRWRSRRRPRRSNGTSTSTAGTARREASGRRWSMKLATLRRGGRDGRLAVVSRDLTRCVLVPGIAPTLQAALDDWATAGPRLAERAATLELGGAQPDALPFDA